MVWVAGHCEKEGIKARIVPYKHKVSYEDFGQMHLCNLHLAIDHHQRLPLFGFIDPGCNIFTVSS